MRLPVAWMLIGGSIAGVVTVGATPLDTDIIVAMRFLGTICALICRIGVGCPMTGHRLCQMPQARLSAHHDT